MTHGKKRYAVVCLLLGAMMLLGACAQPSPQGTTQATPPPSASGTASAPAEPAVKTGAPLTVTYWTGMHPNAAKVLTTWNDNECFQELERRTGVHVDFTHPPIGQELEQYNLMVASRELPDIVCYEYPDGADKAFADSIYRPLDDLMGSNPNMQLIIDSDPEIRKQMTTNKGHIFGWAQFNLPENQGDEGQYAVSPWGGPAIRTDWLEELNLKVPTTIDQWHEVLVAFRDKKGAYAPLILSKSGLPWQSAFVGAYGVGAEFYRVDNVVKYGPMEPGFKEYLKLMNSWYNEKLLDPDFAATASDKNFYSEYLTTGKAGAIDSTFQDIVPLYNSLFTDGKGKISAVPYPSLKEGETVHLGVLSPIVESGSGRRDYLTTAVKDDRVEAVCRWRDSWYTKESYMLFNYGIEGRSYNLADGKPVFTDLIAKNPDGLDYAVASWKYKLFCGPYSYNAFAMPDPQIEASWASISVWNSNNDRVNQLPPCSVPMESATEFNNIKTEVNTYKDQMILKFIMGAEPLDGFDAYVAELKSLGIERAITLQQQGLDLYNSH
jgi:putative aldouronate transport system substrate-binding protein